MTNSTPMINATSSVPFVWSEVFMYGYVVTGVVIAFIALVGNTSMMFLITSVKKLQKPTNLFLLSLVTADILTSTVIIPMYIESFLHRENGIKCMCLLQKYSFILGTSGSLMSLTIVSIDRMMVISYPYLYIRRLNRKIATIIIICLWFWLIAFNSATFYEFEEWKRILPLCKRGIPKILFFIVTPPGFYIPAILIVLAYIKIFKIARWHNKKMFQQSTPLKRVNLNYSETVKGCEPSQVRKTKTRSTTIITNVSVDSMVDEQTIDYNQHYEQQPVTEIKPKSTTSKPIIINGKGKFHEISLALSRDIKTAKKVGALIGLLVLCWSPTALLYIYTTIKGIQLKPTDSLRYVNEVCIMLSFLNSAINPYLYTMRDKSLKKNAKRLFNKTFRRNNK